MSTQNVSNPLVIHLPSGQSVIGLCKIKGDYLEIHYPHEIMVTPGTSDKHHISLIRYGSFFEVLPELAAPMLRFYMPNALCPPMVPGPELLRAFSQVVERLEALVKTKTDDTTPSNNDPAL